MNGTRRHGRRAFSLVEALVALALLGLLLLTGTTFLPRRRQLEKERLDREIALRALRSEWTVLRTGTTGGLPARERGPFLGPGPFIEAVLRRQPRLTIRPAEFPGLVFVRLEIDSGVRNKQRLVQEGFVQTKSAP